METGSNQHREASIALCKNLFIALTYKCNAYCAKCMTRNHIHTGAEMDERTLDSIIDYLQTKDYRGLVSVGTGEPLLYPRLSSFIDQLFTINDDIHLRLLTNGMAMTATLPKSVFSSRSTIGVTFDAFNQRTLEGIQRGVDLDIVKQNVKDVVRLHGGDFIYLNYTLYKRNLGELLPFCQFAVENGIRKVYVTEIKIYEGYENELGEERPQHDSRFFDTISEAKQLLKRHEISTHGICRENFVQHVGCFRNGTAAPVIDVDGAVSLCSGREDVHIGNICDSNIDEKYERFVAHIHDDNKWCRLCHDHVLPNGNYRLPSTIIKR